MALDANATRCLLYAKTLGVSSARTAMLGRQRLVSSADTLQRTFTAFGYSLNKNEITEILSRGLGYAEPFLERLGATKIKSFDASDWENASDVSDFNLPIGEAFKNRFTAVIDGGTLEHIFNFPVAIANCMEMLEVGGHFVAITPANNFMGHGFYQFSPELFFGLFTAANGFNIVQIILFEHRPQPEWFEVRDPEAVRERVTVVNTRPTLLLVVARKVASVRVLGTPPQQTGYLAVWKAASTDAAPRVPSWALLKASEPRVTPSSPASVIGDERRAPSIVRRLRQRLFRLAPAPLQRAYVRLRNPQYRHYPYDPRFFRRIDIPPARRSE